ncbi:MAG: ferritin family protein [Eubacteriales bacterium]|nr:ferritin family protein [Eubacteriales bacterium]
MNTKSKIIKIDQSIQFLPQCTSFSVIGDPGCEGLGTSMMQVYANALEEASRDDFILIAGDLVPIGDARHYRTICDITNSLSEKDVYVLRGNHDTGAYCDSFGLMNYALIRPDFTIVVLDNAMRRFDPEGLELLGAVLSREDCNNVVISFHIPLPNNFIKNCVSQEEYEKLRKVYLPYKDKIKYFVCGHVHSRFEDLVDGIPFICTGGGGAMIEDVSQDIKASDIDYHIVRFQCKSGTLSHEIIDLGDRPYTREIKDSIAKEKLADTVKGELYAHLHYLTFAERAEKRGYDKIANLFYALAESEYRHARSFFSILNKTQPFAETGKSFIANEVFEYEKLYAIMQDYSKEQDLPLSRQAYRDAAAAEKIHADLLKEAVDLDNFERDTIYVCPVCGFVMTDEKERCPICGAPARVFKEYVAGRA